MYQYTTPTLPVTIPEVDFSEVSKFRIAIKSGSDDYLLFVVDADDPIVDAQTKTIMLELTQEQTTMLEIGKGVVQARIIYNTGKVQATKKANVSIDDVIDEEIV